MAENKKAVNFYCDWKETFDSLPDEKAGQLIKHFLSYVNDENPQTDDVLIKAVFAGIKATLKRDLKKWEKRCEKNKENALKRWNKEDSKEMPNDAIACKRIFSDAKNADRDRDRDRDRDIITNVINYGQAEFINDWNELRVQHLKKPSHLNTLNGFGSKDKLKELLKSYTRDDFRNALIGLFKQKKLPNNMTSMQSNPTHFLNYFESYLTAYHDKNTELYGKKEIERL